MDFRIPLFVVVFVLGLILSQYEKNQQCRKWYVIIVIALLFLESGLRAYTVGPDTMGYYEHFQSLLGHEMEPFPQSFRTAYIDGTDRDIGYVYFVKWFQIFSDNFTIFLILCAAIFFIPFGLLLYRFSSDIFELIFAFSLYISLFHIIPLSGIRQQITMGLSFIVMLCLYERKYLISVFIILTGALIHLSLLLFLLLVLTYFFVRNERLRPLHLISLFFAPIAYIKADKIIMTMSLFIANEYYSQYSTNGMSGGANTYIVLLEMLSLFCYFASADLKLFKEKSNRLLYCALPFATFFAPLINLDGAMIRIGQYFTIFLTLLFPIAFKNLLHGRDAKMSLLFLSLLLAFMAFISSSYSYAFII